MASALKIMERGVHGMDLKHGLTGAGWVVVDGGVELGAGYGIGQLYHRYPDKWYGKHVPKVLALVGKGIAVGIQVLTGANPGDAGQVVGGLANALGSAGLTAWGLEMGLDHARKSSGKQAVLLPKGAALPAGATKITKIGALPPAPANGKALTLRQIEEFANMH